MSPAGEQILQHLMAVDHLRRGREADPARGARVRAVKAYQARRFAHTYADLLASARYQAAARFFLDELYGPQEFAARDAQFARIVPALVRMFPEEIVHTVASLARLHALSEELDESMAAQLSQPLVDASTYLRLWRHTGRRADRETQIELTLAIGEALDRYTRNPVLRGGLRLMRRPAQAAGLGELQHFLETGFDTFGRMKGATDFLAMVREREWALCEALFDGPAVTSATSPSTGASTTIAPALGQLP